MNAPYPDATISKPCARAACARRLWLVDYPTRGEWRRTRYCCRLCAAGMRGSVKWEKLMAHQVREGESMTLQEIATVAGTSRQCIQQCLDLALRKLAKRAQVMRLRQWLEP